MTHYLKNSLFFLIILMMPYMNIASKAMDPEDTQESTLHSRTTLVKKGTADDFTSASTFSKQSTSQSVNLEDAQTSWLPSPSSLLKTTMRMGSEVINNNKGLIIGAIILFCKTTAVAAGCACYCFNNGPRFYGSCSSDMAGCNYDCAKIGFSAISCVPGDKGC